jgi:hypothetical protein
VGTSGVRTRGVRTRGVRTSGVRTRGVRTSGVLDDGGRGLQQAQGELHNVVHGHEDEQRADEGNEALANEV